jgi:hypothetical protein
MRGLLKSSGRRLRTGWFWPLVLLALPNCILESGGLGPPPVYEGGANPTFAIMCDIPKIVETDCATSTEVGIGMPLSHAAVALVQGEQSSLALDLSPAAEAACSGSPKKIEFNGTFPDGYAICINCGTQKPIPYPDGNAACVAQCIDLIHYGGQGEPPGGAQAFCEANAHVSTNFDKDECYADACGSDAGTLAGGFVDPRRAQEPVIWEDLIGASDTGNTLTRTAAGTASFSAGGASKQIISHGDGWVEFDANETNMGHIVGLSETSDPPPADADASQFDIGFGITLATDGNVYTIEDGTPTGPIGTYTAGERFRVWAVDNHDGTASITFFRVAPGCVPGTICTGNQIGGSATHPSYPLRVDASLSDLGAQVNNVTLVRIK